MLFDFICKVTAEHQGRSKSGQIIIGLGRTEKIDLPLFLIHLGNLAEGPVQVTKKNSDINIIVLIEGNDRLNIISGKISVLDFILNNIKQYYLENPKYLESKPARHAVLKDIFEDRESLAKLISSDFSDIVIGHLLNKEIAVQKSVNPFNGYKSVL